MAYRVNLFSALVILGNTLPELPDTVHASMTPLVISVSNKGRITSEPVIAGFIFVRTAH